MFASVSRARSIARFWARCSWQRGPRDDIGPLGSTHIGDREPGRLPARNGLVSDGGDRDTAQRSILRGAGGVMTVRHVSNLLYMASRRSHRSPQSRNAENIIYNVGLQ